MAKPQRIRDFRIHLQAGVPRSLNVDGSFYNVLSADGTVELQFDESTKVTRSTGMSGTGANYERVTVTSAIDQTVVLCLGHGAVSDNKITLSDESVKAVGSTVPNSSGLIDDVTVPANTTFKIMDANPSRREVSIFSLASNLPDCRIGFNNTTSANRGGVIVPEGVATLATTSEIWVFNPHLTESATFAILESEVL